MEALIHIRDADVEGNHRIELVKRWDEDEEVRLDDAVGYIHGTSVEMFLHKFNATIEKLDKKRSYNKNEYVDDNSILELGKNLYKLFIEYSGLGSHVNDLRTAAHKKEEELCLRLIVPSSLEDIPFEYIHFPIRYQLQPGHKGSRDVEIVLEEDDTRQWLGCREDNINISIARQFSLEFRDNLPLATGIIYFLVIEANPRDDLKLLSELKWITSSRLQNDERIQIRIQRGTTPQSLCHFLHKNGPDGHIIYFTGHSGYHPETGGQLILCSETPNQDEEKLPAQKFAELIAQYSSIRLMIFNSCRSAQGGKKPNLVDAVLKYTQIPAVIGMRAEIQDSQAIHFIQEFCNAIVEQPYRLIQYWVQKGRKKIEGDEWGYPILYMNTKENRLFLSPTEWRIQNYVQSILRTYRPDERHIVKKVVEYDVENRKAVPPAQPLLEEVQDSNILLIGPPNCGKHTLLAHLIYQCASEWPKTPLERARRSSRMPLWVELADLLESDMANPREQFRAYLESILPEATSMFETGDCLIIVSGIENLSSDYHQRLLQLLRVVSQPDEMATNLMHRNKWVLACTDTIEDLQALMMNLSSLRFKVCTIEPWTVDEIIQLYQEIADEYPHPTNITLFKSILEELEFLTPNLAYDYKRVIDSHIPLEEISDDKFVQIYQETFRKAGFEWSNLQFRAAEVSEGSISRIPEEKFDISKWRQGYYVKRAQIEEELHSFIQGSEIGFSVIGRPGTGKTTLMAKTFRVIS